MTSDESGIKPSPGTFVWYPCSDNNGLAESFGVPGEISFGWMRLIASWSNGTMAAGF